MKFKVLALDYDGTIAVDGRLDPNVRAAIGDARARGVVVVLVTGRVLTDLHQVAGELDFLDAVVAENGGHIWFPNGISRLMGQPPPDNFVQELRRRGISISVGRCIVEADASAAPGILAVIREMELPLLLLFNRRRLMVLPQGVSKGVGLRAALSAMRLSVHNAIGIGDAENDHDLLSTCELGVAAGWGSRTLQKSADEVLPGSGPAAVAGYVRRMAGELRLPHERAGHYKLSLGMYDDGGRLEFPLRGRNILISGDPRSGKSWVAGAICEQMILQGYSVCVIDPEGDYRTLEPLPGVVILGGTEEPPPLTDVAQAVRHPDMSVVIDLCHLAHEKKVQYLYTLLPILAAIRRSTGLPHRIVVDEAHYFLHEPNIRDLLDLNLGAYTLVTYRLNDLHPDVRNAVEMLIVKRTTDPQEVQTLLKMCKEGCREAEWASQLDALTIGQGALLPGCDEAQGRFRRFELFPRLTSHIRHKAKYLDVQLVESQAFYFTSDNGTPLGRPARTLKEFSAAVKFLPSHVLARHANRGDFSRWIMGVFHDRLLESDMRKIEHRSMLGHEHNIANSLLKAIHDRYEFSSEIATEPVTKKENVDETVHVLSAA